MARWLSHAVSFFLFALALSWGAAPRALPAAGPAFERYAVVADHPKAAEAGAALLKAGGNAADAAAATMLALGVVSPAGSGLGGGGFALYYRARDRSLTFLDFRETAPGAADARMFEAKARQTEAEAQRHSRQGGAAVAVPGEPMGIAELVSRFGTKSLSEVVAPAERLARQGFEVSEHLGQIAGYVGAALLKDPLMVAVFGGALRPGAPAKNLQLADTLRSFAASGPKLFYTGALSRQIVAAVQRAGGVMQAADLAGYRVVTRAPLRSHALGYAWATAPAPSAGGYTLLASLAFLERVLPSHAHFAGPARYHALIESWKGPYLDRQRYFGDPDHVDVPVEPLLAPDRQAARAARYHPALAVSPRAFALPLEASGRPAAVSPEDHGTSHLCVVDAEGNVAAVTTTINLAFGAHISVAGLWLNNEMDDFAREVGKQNAFGLVGGAANLPAPGKRPVSSMSPTLVFQGDAPVLCVGGSGGSRIPTAVEQVALYVLKDGLHPLAAIQAPRLHYQVAPERVDVRDVPQDLQHQLRIRGHILHPGGWAANVQAIRIGREGPRLLAGADPYKGGGARGE